MGISALQASALGLLLFAAACAGPRGSPVPPAPDPAAPPEVQLAHARALAEAGYGRSALEAVDAVLAGEPDRAEALRLKASLLESAGDEREAVAVLDRLSDRAPGDLQSLYRSGAARLRIGEVDEALPRLRRYAEAAPGDGLGRRAFGTALYRKALAGGAHDAALLSQAEAEFRAAASLEPGDAGAHHDLASLLVVRGERDGAEVEYRKALQWSPEHLPSLEGLAELLAAQGRKREAGEIAARALPLEGHPQRRRNLERWIRAEP